MKPYSPTRDALWIGSVALFALNRWWIIAVPTGSVLDADLSSAGLAPSSNP